MYFRLSDEKWPWARYGGSVGDEEAAAVFHPSWQAVFAEMAGIFGGCLYVSVTHAEKSASISTSGFGPAMRTGDKA
jgi:hypothetical protein